MKLCPRGCATPFEHKLHVWEPVLGNAHVQRELLLLSKKLLRPVAAVLTKFVNAPDQPSKTL